MEAHRPAPHRSHDHHESRKEYRDPSVSRRIHLPAAVRLRGARTVLQFAASRRMDLDQIAVLFGVNRDHLLRIFRQAGYLSPMREVRRLHLEGVVGELRNTDKSLETLARQFGYADGSSLSRALHRAFGQWPSELRNGPDSE